MKTYKQVLIGAIVGFAIGSVVANPAYVTGEPHQQAVTPAAATQYSPSGYFPAEYQLSPSASERPVYEY